mgnify:CR=1 FL=1
MINALRILQKKYPKITETVIQQGLSHTIWHGRMEQIGTGPDFYLDGAHNEDAVRKLRKTLDESFSNRRIVYIMGVLADKDYEKNDYDDVSARRSRIHCDTSESPGAGR